LSKDWGQPVVTENKAGGNGVIAGEELAKSAPDGYTIMITSSAHIITPLLAPTPFDAINDFTSVATLATSENMLVVNPSVPAQNLQQFIAYAKSKPGELNYATGGAGTLAHLAGALFDNMAGVKMQQVPYKSGGPAIADLLGGHVQLYFAVPISIMPHVKSGGVRPIAVTGATRLPALPNVPTFAEAGLPGFDVKYWFGIFAPARLPSDIAARYSAEIAKILASPEATEKLVSQGMSPFISTPDEMLALERKETAMYTQIIKSADIKLAK
jgi:tripartite-type tricarboxylate transporter receptor subunit TctC